MSEPEVALVLSPEAWVERFHRQCTDHGGARVRQVVMDPALALEDEYSTLVVSHRWPALTPALVDALHKRGRALLGVYDPSEPAAREHLAALGVDGMIRADAEMSAFVQAVAALSPPRARRDDAGNDAGAGHEHRRSAYRLIAVGGPAGSGATEIAIGLAEVFSTRRKVVLVDADEVTPSVAARLGLPIEPNLRSAIDAVEFGIGRLSRVLLRVPGSAFGVLGGLPNVAAWSQVRPSEVVAVTEALGEFVDELVVNVGHQLEDIGGRRGRYGISRTLLPEADVIVAVCPATPIGVSRVLSWLADARALASNPPVVLAINRAPKDRYRRAEIADEIIRTFAPTTLVYVPDDRRVQVASWFGTPVGRSSFTRALRSLAVDLEQLESRATRASQYS